LGFVDPDVLLKFKRGGRPVDEPIRVSQVGGGENGLTLFADGRSEEV